MATLTITIVVPDSIASVTDQLQGVGTITQNSNQQSNVARYVDGIANGSFNMTSFTTAVA